MVCRIKGTHPVGLRPKAFTERVSNLCSIRNADRLDPWSLKFGQRGNYSLVHIRCAAFVRHVFVPQFNVDWFELR